jgi:hypothetical protein
MAIKLYVVAPNIFGFTIWSLLHITLLVPVILRQILDFEKCVHPCLAIYLGTSRTSKHGSFLCENSGSLRVHLQFGETEDI